MKSNFLLLSLSPLLLLGCDASPNSEQVQEVSEERVEKPTNAGITTFGEEELQGTWKVIESTSDGKVNEDAIGVEYTFSSSSLLIRRPGRNQAEKHRYEIDITQDPPHLDALVTVFGNERALPGIFRIQNGDIAWYSTVSANPRPTTFTADKKGYSYYLLRRVLKNQ
jgi:uncharacterized protein (TIGR03067 family)